MSEHDPVLSEPDAANYLGLSHDTLKRIRKRGEIDYIKLSPNRVGYRRSQCDKLLTDCTVRATVSLMGQAND
jgi:predicted site-specific integrase-resolvase